MVGTPGTRRSVLLAGGLLLMAGAAALYAPTISTGFLAWDDYDTVVFAPDRPWSEILTGVVFKTWLPVYFGSLRLDADLFGVSRPWGFRLVNVLLHGLNAGLVFVLLRRILPGTLPAALAAAVFLVHPAATESVAWISERKGLLAFTFGLLSMAVFASAGEREGRARWLRISGAAALLALALLAKGSALAVPLVLGLLTWIRALPGARWRDLLPLAAVAAGLTVLHYGIALAEGPARAVAGGEVPSLLLADVVVLGNYLRLLFAPAWGQSLVPDLGPGAWRDPLALALSAAAVAAAAAALVVARRRDRLAFAGLSAALLALLPFNNLVPRTEVLYAERYAYFPLLGVSILAAAVAARGRVAAAVVGVAAAGLLALSVSRAAVWGDEVGVFRDAAEKAPRSWLANMKLGDALKMRAAAAPPARAAEARAALAEAAGRFSLAVDLARGPEQEVRSRVDLGGALLAAGRPPEEVLAALDPALPRLDALPPEAAGPLRLEIGLNRGTALLMLSRDGEAEEAYRAAAQAAPRDPRALSGLSAALARRGDLGGAANAAREAVALDPADEGATVALAEALLLAEQDGEARRALEAVVALRPSVIRPRVLLGQMALGAGRPRDAMAQFAAVLAAVPRHAAATEGMVEARLMLARGALSRGQKEEARREILAAVEANPASAGAVVLLAEIEEDPARAEEMLAAAAGLPGGAPAREALARRRLEAAGEALRAGEEARAAEAMRSAIRTRAARLSADGRREAGGLLEDLTALADRGPGAGTEDLLRGVAAFLAGDDARAEEALERSIRDALNRPEAAATARLALLFRGRSRAEAGRIAEARLDFDMARDLGPADPWPLIYAADALAKAAVEEKNRAAGGEGDAARAEALFADARAAAESALARAPGRFEPLLRLGEIELASGRYLDALRALSRAKREFPDRPEPRLDLAALYKTHFLLTEEKDYLRGALEELGEALRLAPGDARARAALGELLLLAGQTRRAAAELARAVAEDPSLVEAREMLAGLYVTSGRSRLDAGGAAAVAEAKQFAQLALALGTASALPHLLLADAARLAKDFGPAQQHLADARARQPDLDEVKDALARYHRDLGYAYLLRHGEGDEERSLAEFRKALAAGSKNEDLGPVKARLGLAEEGTEPPALDPKVEEVLRQRTEEARRAFDESGRLLAAGDLAGAEREARRSLAARRTAEALHRLGEVLEAAERPDEAADAWRGAVELKPSLHQSWLALGMLLYRRGELAGAVEAFEGWLRAAGDDAPLATREQVKARIEEMRGKLGGR